MEATVSRSSRPVLGAALAVLGLTATAGAQQEPHLGYAYPAGGQRGTELEITLGGQHLDGASALIVSGDGVTATVGKHRKPIGGKKLQAVRQKLQEARKELRAARKERPRGERGPQMQPIEMPEVQQLLDTMGIDEVDVHAFMELRRKRNDPLGQVNAQLSETVVVRLRIAGDAAPGERELRLLTRRGLTNPLRFEVGQHPEVREVEATDGEPQRLEATPAVINGQILPGDVDRFRLHGRAGERLVAAVAARSLIPYLADAVPGWFQATLTLTGPDGQEVAFSDDYTFHPDPTFGVELPRDGDYVLEIKDAIYRGREDFVYRITVGEVPFVTGLFPLGGPAGAETRAELQGWNLDGRAVTVAGAGAPGGVIPVAATAGGVRSNAVPFALGELPEGVEQEPNDEAPQPVAMPRLINGRIARPGDRDRFLLEGRAGDVVVAEVVARRLESPLDSLLLLTDAEGHLVAGNDDHEDPASALVTHHADSRLSVTLPADGSYRLELADAQRHGGPTYAYRLRVSLQRPDFDLRVVPATVNARAGQTVPVTVHVFRRDGYAGPVDLRLVDAPHGFVLSGGRIPAGQDRVRATLSVSGAATAPTALRMVGAATVAGRAIERPVVPADDVMQAFLNRHLVTAQEWIVAVLGGGRRGAPAPRLLAPTPVAFPRGGAVELRFSAPPGAAKRAKELGFQLELSDPPAGVTLDGWSLGPLGLSVRLRIADEAAAGAEGNLILAASVQRALGGKAGQKKKAKKRKIPIGVLPAVPFRVVEPRPPSAGTWFSLPR